MKHLQLALTLLRRDIRNGELTLLMLALLIAVTTSATISLFSDRLQRTLQLQASQFMAGDLVITSSQPIDASLLQSAAGIRQSETAEFTSMLLENQQTLLVAAKAVSATYPLRGHLKIRDQQGQERLAEQGPPAGEAWVEQKVLTTLQLQLGQRFTLGEQTLVVSALLLYEPDKSGDFYSFLPRVIFNQSDLAATAVIQPGSRVSYGYQFSGDQLAVLAFKAGLQQRLLPGQKIRDIYQDRPELGSAFQRAERYLGLSSVLVILIAGVAIAMAAGRYSERHFDSVAVLRCLGCRQNDIVRLFSWQFLLLGLSLSATGCGLGWVAQYGLLVLLADLLPAQLAAPSGWAILLGFISGMLMLLGFALPPLLRLRRVSPLRVLRRDLLPLPTAGWLVYGLALLLLTGFVSRYSNDWQMVAKVMAGSVVVLAVLAAIVSGLLRMLQSLKAVLGLSGRLAIQSLLQHGRTSSVQIVAFSMTLSVMLLSFSIRNDLISNWQQQLPAQAPNHFVLNILPAFKDALVNDLAQAGVVSSDYYPVVRGRLLAVNQQPVTKRVSKDSQGEAATQRELSLTSVAVLPADNQLTAGQLWPEQQPNWVSVEQKLAENLGIQVGDQLEFSVTSTHFIATVSSLRGVQWDSLKPNFYMIFSPGTLDSFPTTWMSSFYLASDRQALINDWVQRYPAITILDVGQWLQQIKTLLKQLTAVLDYVLYFALAAGICVLLTAVSASLDQRLYQGALMRTLGASRSLIVRMQWMEFGLLGAISGVLAVSVAELLRWLIYQKLLQMDYQPVWQYWLIVPLLSVILIVLTASLGLRPVLNQSPVRVLRQ